MPDLNNPDPLNPLQARAYALLRAIAKSDLSRPELVEINGGNDGDTKKALRFLRDHSHIHICGYTGLLVEPVFRFGLGIDAPRPKGVPLADRRKAITRPVVIPPPDPLLAALFGRPVPE